jgi:imidazolonepropionase-like amidohydrolase
MKSGYGLNLENEIKILDAINHLKDKYKAFIKIIPTFMAAHAFPPEF